MKARALEIEIDATQLRLWNYRMVTLPADVVDPAAESGVRRVEFYSIHEAYYRPTSILPECISDSPVGPIGMNPEEIAHDIELIKTATAKPPVDGATMPRVDIREMAKRKEEWRP